MTNYQEVTSDTVPELVGDDGFGVPTLAFTKDDSYTTFNAEHAISGNDIVLHFFPPPELIERAGQPLVYDQVRFPSPNHYWLKEFPVALEQAVIQAFQAPKERLRIEYTAELASWYLKAQGFALQGVPDDRVAHFYRLLDAAIEALIASR
jgi:hypothetical protein